MHEKVSQLYRNALDSIQLGVEDYQSNDPKRVISAVRNYYGGVLLLAKEVLANSVPDANPDELLGENYKPVRGESGIEFIQKGPRTIDASSIQDRFDDFEIEVDLKPLKALQRIRNDVEHRYTDQPASMVRNAIATSFVVVADLFRELDQQPAVALGAAWNTMLEAKGLYDRELAACNATFADVKWTSATLSNADFVCPECDSNLLAQADPENTSQSSMDCICRNCGKAVEQSEVVVAALNAHLGAHDYIAVKDGGEPAVYDCPECSNAAYLIYGEDIGCAVCEFQLDDECVGCGTSLTPENVAWDNHHLCSYCEHVLNKDD